MPLLLARVDDRLIHGQVAHGWGQELRPTLFIVVSDELAADPDRAGLYLFAVPEGARGQVLSVRDALDASVRSAIEKERTVLLFPGLDEPLRLIEAGFPLPSVFLDDQDRERLRRIDARGVRIRARDLPSNPEHPLDEILPPCSPS